MTEMPNLKTTSSREVAEALKSVDLSREQLQAVLVSIFERIATNEESWEQLGEIFQLFNEQMSAARTYGGGLLKEQ